MLFPGTMGVGGMTTIHSSWKADVILEFPLFFPHAISFQVLPNFPLASGISPLFSDVILSLSQCSLFIQLDSPDSF